METGVEPSWNPRDCSQIPGVASVEVCLGLASSLVNRLRCLPVVVVMQATQHWARRKRPVDRRFFWPYRSARDALLDPLMRPSAVKVPFVFLHDSVQMSSAQNQDVVQTFSPQAAEEALAYGGVPSVRTPSVLCTAFSAHRFLRLLARTNLHTCSRYPGSRNVVLPQMVWLHAVAGLPTDLLGSSSPQNAPRGESPARQ